MSDTEMNTEGQAAATEVAEGSLLEQIMSETKMAPSDDGYDVALQGVNAFIAELVK